MTDAAMLRPDDVIAAAVTVEAALKPVVGRDWSVRAGTLKWDVERTILHTIGAPAKYTLYLASRCEHYLALTIMPFPEATNEEVVDSVVPVASGLAAVAAVPPPDVRAFHVTGPSGELLVHAEDALSGLGVAFAPPADLCRRVLAQQYPDAAGPGNPWHRLLAANGRPIR